jgi:hypothetical protein
MRYFFNIGAVFFTSYIKKKIISGLNLGIKELPWPTGYWLLL